MAINWIIRKKIFWFDVLPFHKCQHFSSTGDRDSQYCGRFSFRCCNMAISDKVELKSKLQDVDNYK